MSAALCSRLHTFGYKASYSQVQAFTRLFSTSSGSSSSRLRNDIIGAELTFLPPRASFATTTTSFAASNRQTMADSKQHQGKDMTNWASQDGSFKRQTSAFRDAITRDPNGKFPAEKGRYYLYVSLACPWAHRTLIVRKLKGLEDFIRALDYSLSLPLLPMPYYIMFPPHLQLFPSFM